MRVWLIALIFLNGFISLSLELVILRQLSFWVGSSPVITSIIMGAFLGFMSLGYWLGNSERVRIKYIPKILCFSFLFIAALALFAASFPFVTTYFALMYTAGITSGVIQTFIYSFVFYLLVHFCLDLIRRYCHACYRFAIKTTRETLWRLIQLVRLWHLC